MEDPIDKVVVMAKVEGLRPGPLFDSLSKNVPETLSTLQSKADKYIATEKLAKAKRKRRERDDKRKEPDTRYLRKYVVDQRPPDSLERRYSDNRPTAGDIQVIHNGFGSGRYSISSRKRHAKRATRRAKEEIYNLPSPIAGTHLPITFTNDDLRGLHLPHDDALVISAAIANFNIWRKYYPPTWMDQVASDLGNGASPNHHLARFHCDGLPFIVQCDLRSLDTRRNKGNHLNLSFEMKFPTSIGIGEVKGDQKVARQCFISAMKAESPPKPSSQ
ncbi:hypothetical protein Acr_16g0000650 [Actinidia rufa]|uniref:Uncharacterized protein n=1 Tax=Actinidia rufa TaxID=165716 RepID=A0A7J0FXL7_9ERIC|nr:hypothetical protein Acr_16g0000650 [Actinidia rufa]